MRLLCLKVELGQQSSYHYRQVDAIRRWLLAQESIASTRFDCSLLRLIKRKNEFLFLPEQLLRHKIRPTFLSVRHIRELDLDVV